ncbi:MAG: hypothetical protein J5I94_08505 [Phaeodactylibacter sp.]|nr:hypothetical protein [Phaeodactylibacter sp.]
MLQNFPEWLWRLARWGSTRFAEFRLQQRGSGLRPGSYWLVELLVIGRFRFQNLEACYPPFKPNCREYFPVLLLPYGREGREVSRSNSIFFKEFFRPGKTCQVYRGLSQGKPGKFITDAHEKTNLSNKILVPGLHYFICFSILRNILSPEGNFTLKLIFQINEDACSGPGRRRECRIFPLQLARRDDTQACQTPLSC